MFFILPMGVDYSARRYPVVTFTLMGLNIAVYLVSLVYFWNNGLEGKIRVYETFWLIPSESTWHTFLTSMFVHGGFFHLLGNMIYLFLFGSCVKDIIGRWQYCLFYFLGGLAAALAHVVMSIGHAAYTIPMGGASGAVSTCIGGFVLLLAKTKINFRYFIFLFFRFWTGEFWVPAWLVISFWFLKDLFFAILSHLDDGTGGGVAFAAHVGGFIGGAAMIGAYKGLTKLWAHRAQPAANAETLQPQTSLQPNEPAYIYLYENEQTLGPYTLTQVQQMLDLGSLDDSVCYWYEGMADWQPVGDLR